MLKIIAWVGAIVLIVIALAMPYQDSIYELLLFFGAALWLLGIGALGVWLARRRPAIKAFQSYREAMNKVGRSARG
jgi:uncharacterized membrane protein YccC